MIALYLIGFLLGSGTMIAHNVDEMRCSLSDLGFEQEYIDYKKMCK